MARKYNRQKQVGNRWQQITFGWCLTSKDCGWSSFCARLLLRSRSGECGSQKSRVWKTGEAQRSRCKRIYHANFDTGPAQLTETRSRCREGGGGWGYARVSNAECRHTSNSMYRTFGCVYRSFKWYSHPRYFVTYIFSEALNGTYRHISTFQPKSYTSLSDLSEQYGKTRYPRIALHGSIWRRCSHSQTSQALKIVPRLFDGIWKYSKHLTTSFDCLVQLTFCTHKRFFSCLNTLIGGTFVKSSSTLQSPSREYWEPASSNCAGCRGWTRYLLWRLLIR